MKTYDVLIIGAGAAGLMCAIRAGQRGLRVGLIDHTDQVGAKILISGGGRCNFTNSGVKADRYFSGNPHFCKSALARYTPQDFIDLVNKHKIVFHEKTLGQLFCDQSARQIVQMLLDECAATGVVDILLKHHVQGIEKPDQFRVMTDKGGYAAPSLVLATGGLSIPKMGATDFSHRIARQFGMAMKSMRPALVPLTFTESDLARARQVTGLAVEVSVSCGKVSFRENMLFTHRGISGPAILQISSAWREGQAITVNLAPDKDILAFLRDRKQTRGKAELKSILSEQLPQNLARLLAQEQGIAGRNLADYADKDLVRIAQAINAWGVEPVGTEGYAKAEVTLGGIDTAGLSSKTMESQTVPGLYVIGEAVDVTGWLGGYNFQWAWASGWVAGSSVSSLA